MVTVVELCSADDLTAITAFGSATAIKGMNSVVSVVRIARQER